MSTEERIYQSWTITEVNVDKEDDTLFTISCLLDEDNKTTGIFTQDVWYYQNVNRDPEDYSLPKVGDKLVLDLATDEEIEQIKKIYNI